MIYIPTSTGYLQDKEYEYLLYSPSQKYDKIVIGKKITIWDNHTFYLMNRLRKPNKKDIAIEHYKWFIEFIKQNWQEGVTVVTPDTDWLKTDEIELLWLKNCKQYPQLYVPNSWINDTKDLNVVGHALRANTPNKFVHPKWTHLFAHRRDCNSELVTYDSVNPQPVFIKI